MPFSYTKDGEFIRVFVRKLLDGNLVIHDGGGALRHLESMRCRVTDSRMEKIRSLLRCEGCGNGDADLDARGIRRESWFIGGLNMVRENMDYLSEIEYLLQLVPSLLTYERVLPCIAKIMEMDAQMVHATPPARYTEADWERMKKIVEEAMGIAERMGGDPHWIRKSRRSLRECAYHLVRASIYVVSKDIDKNVSYYHVPGLWRHKLANAWSRFVWSYRF